MNPREGDTPARPQRRKIPLTVAEIRRLFNVRDQAKHLIDHALHWSSFRREHCRSCRRSLRELAQDLVDQGDRPVGHNILRAASDRPPPHWNRNLGSQTGRAPRRSEAGLTTTTGLKLGS